MATSERGQGSDKDGQIRRLQVMCEIEVRKVYGRLFQRSLQGPPRSTAGLQ
jgi:hypothetical protein